MILKITIMAWVLCLILRKFIKATMTREQLIEMQSLNKPVTPAMLLYALFFIVSLILTVISTIWILFFVL